MQPVRCVWLRGSGDESCLLAEARMLGPSGATCALFWVPPSRREHPLCEPFPKEAPAFTGCPVSGWDSWCMAPLAGTKPRCSWHQVPAPHQPYPRHPGHCRTQAVWLLDPETRRPPLERWILLIFLPIL